jgi:hypothetical protein
MLKEMINYYAPLLTSLKVLLGYKGAPTVGAAITSAAIVEAFALISKASFLGVSVPLLLILIILIVSDQIIGTLASLQLAKQAEERGDVEGYKENKFKSVKISYTIFKFISLYLWLLLSFSMYRHTRDLEYLGVAVRTVSLIPIFLFGFREYISIGESIEIISGRKPYLFEMGEKMFTLIQFKFLRRLGGEDADAFKEEQDKQNKNNEDGI